MIAWLRIFCKISLHILLLPLKLLVNLLLGKLIFPDMKYDASKYLTEDSIKDKRSQVEKFKNDLNLEGYIEDGDGAKFLGLAYTSSKDKKIWDCLSQLLYKGISFLRAPYTDDYDRVAFSGDMWAGMFPAICTAIREGHITEPQKKQIGEIINYTLFKEKTLTFKHPTETTQDRGFCFPFWSMGSNILDVISLCYLGEVLTKEFKYKFLRYVFTVIGFPILFFGLRQGIFIRNVYAMNFFTEHSALVKAFYTYKFCGYTFLKRAIIKQCNDNPWFMDSGKILKNINKDDSLYNVHLNDYLNTTSFESLPPEWVHSYFSLKGFEKTVNFSLYSLPYRFRSGLKYSDDSKPMEPKKSSKRLLHTNIIHLYDWD